MKIKDLRKVTNYKFLNMYELDYTDMRGNDKSWQFASRNPEPKCVHQTFSEPDAVVIVPLHTRLNKLVVIEEFRVPLTGYQFGFPAGLVDEGESIAEAGKRELKEETGLDLTKVLMQSPPVYSTSGMTDESVCMLYVECEGKADNKQNESSEDIKTHFLSQQETKELLQDRSIKFDVKTWLVLSAFAQTGALIF